MEFATLSWNVVGTVVVLIAAVAAGSVALAGFGLDSLIEIGASTVVIWQLRDSGQERERVVLRLIGTAAGKARTGAALGNRVLQAEARVTLIDACLAAAVLVGLVLNAGVDWWWADPAAGLVIVYYGLREGREALQASRESPVAHRLDLGS